MHLLSTLSTWSSLQHATISPSFLLSFIQFIPLNIHRSPRRRRREARSTRVSLLKKKVQQSNPLKLLLKNCLALIWHPPRPHHSRSDDRFSSRTACYICICPHFWRRINRQSTFLVCQISCIWEVTQHKIHAKCPIQDCRWLRDFSVSKLTCIKTGYIPGIVVSGIPHSCVIHVPSCFSCRHPLVSSSWLKTRTSKWYCYQMYCMNVFPHTAVFYVTSQSST